MRIAIYNLLLIFAAGLSSAAAGEQHKLVVPFDFVSRFDNGRYGEALGDMVWAKIRRAGKFSLPESMLDVRDICRQSGGRPSPDMPLERVRKLVEDGFAGQIGVWGSVERVPGHQTDVYDLVIKCVDFSATDGPKVIYQCNARTKTVSEIPHLYVKEMLDSLYGRTRGGGAKGASPIFVGRKLGQSPAASEEEKWQNGPNLVVGGDFQAGAGGVPKGWEPVAGQQREPFGRLAQWIGEEKGNKFVRLAFDAAVGDNEGVMYYSLPFPVLEGAKYRFQCRWRSNGPRVIVFIKCFDTSLPARKPEKGIKPPFPGREVYRSQHDLKGTKDTWNIHRQDFTVRHTEYTPRVGRVMLYACTGAGAVDFDDVVIKQIAAPAPQSADKIRRRSTETKTTIKEMEDSR
jgi:hypothetical protein